MIPRPFVVFHLFVYVKTMGNKCEVDAFGAWVDACGAWVAKWGKYMDIKTHKLFLS